MDPSGALLLSHTLVGLSPSMSPPPLGERSKQFERTSHHIDSHRDLTMSHHGFDFPELPPSPPLVVEVEPSSTYGTFLESGPYGVGPS